METNGSSGSKWENGYKLTDNVIGCVAETRVLSGVALSIDNGWRESCYWVEADAIDGSGSWSSFIVVQLINCKASII